MMNVTQALHRNLKMRAHQTAIVGEQGERSWHQWIADIGRLAAGLKARGLREGDRVAIVAHNSDRYLDLFYAIPWAGGVIVPVNTRLSAPEVAYILGHADARLVVCDSISIQLSVAAIEQARIATTLIGMEPNIEGAEIDIDSLAKSYDPCGDVDRRDQDISGIFYTGGTTGRSKGVMLSHANHAVHSLAMWAGRGIDPATLRYLHAAPMFHIADAEFIYGVTTLGGAHYSIPKYEPGAFLEAVERWRITDVVLVPTMIQMLLDHPNLATTDTSSLQRLWYGGSPLAEQTIVRLMAALPKVSPIQLYGQTESAPILTALEAADHNPPPEHRRRLRAAGRPLPGCEIAIVDDNDKPLPAGEVGEIVARSGTLMLGYWQDEEQTAQALKGGWLHTGDAGYMDDDGYVFVTDRFKDMIISGGENIYSVEVEQAIYAHPGVAQCAVIGLSDERWGEAVHAVMVPQPGHNIDLGDLRAALREKLAGYKIPQSFEIRDEPLPTSGAGKILKRELRRQAEEGL